SYRAGRLYAAALAARGGSLPAHLAHLGAASAAGPARQEASAVLARFS
ncbi:lipoyl synthase, partial [Quadrisphaera setariae]